MAEMPWDEYPETQVWLATKKNKWSYWRPFKRFMEFSGVSTPVELLNVTEDEARGRLADFRDLNAGRYATKTTNLYSTAVTSFYERHGKDVKVKRVRQYVAKSYKAFTQSEIRQLVKYADIRTKAIIHCAYSSGARISSILALNVGRIDISAEPPVELKFYPSETKYNVAYITFLSKEAIKAIDLYLKDRSRKGETITPDSMLFLTKYGDNLTANAAGQQLHIIMDRADVNYDKEHERVGNHCFRNAFQRNLQRAGVNQAVIELLMGHSQNSTPQRYTIGHTPEELRAVHMKADWSLGETLVDDVEKLQKRVEFLQSLVESRPSGRVGRWIDDIALENNTSPYEVAQVSIEDLSKYIAQGYELATPNPLPSGEYILRRRR